MDTPEDYKNAGLANLISGGLTVVFSLMTAFALIVFCVGVFWVIPAAMGGYQAWIGYKMYTGEFQPQAKTSIFVGLGASVLTMNIFSIVGSAFALMTIDKPEVKGWLEQHS